MANDRNLINAFDDAIERLTNGESLDSVLKDYPDYADYLSDLLMISERVAEVHSEDEDTVSAQSRGRDKLQQALKEKPKRTYRSRPRWYITTVAAASLMLIVGVGFLINAMQSARGSDNIWMRTQVAMFNSTTEALIDVTQASLSLEATQLLSNATQALPTQESYIAEPTQLLINATATPLSTQAPPTVAPPLSATPSPYVENFDLTATVVAYPQSDVIVTSVASMPQMTATQMVNIAATNVPNSIKVTRMPVQAGSTSTLTPAPTQTAMPTQSQQEVYPVGTVVADASLVQPQPSNDDATPIPLPDLIPLSAGEIDDNADWDRYLLYRRNFLDLDIPVYDIDVTGRQIITVVDSNNRPVLGATVRIIDNNGIVAEHLTYTDGRTMFFPNANERTRAQDEFLVFVEKGELSTSFVLRRSEGTTWLAKLDDSITAKPIQLDILFLIDTTGSMQDEINQLQNNILHTTREVDQLSSDVDVRYGLVIYREHNNWEYVTRRFGFTSDVNQFQTDLNTITANGDGNEDWDEPLNVGLDLSLNEMAWRGEDSIKLIFLVADARPHIDHPLEPITYDQSIQTALARGIKIHPIASSGLEPAGEFIFRQIAQVTMGHFLFLTYDDGVVGTTGNDRPEFDVGQPASDNNINGYTVDSLSDLVLRLIQDELLSYISPLPSEATGEINN